MADRQKPADSRFWDSPEFQRKFEADRVLGTGGMGVVVLARQRDLDRPVAIKFLHPEVLQDPEPVGRFLREGRAAAQLRSEHVCRVLDVGELPTVGPYLVMEYLQGQDFEALLRERGRLPIGEAVSLVLQACEAIAEAHACGIVHRDLKPSNLFLTHDAFGAPCVKVLDFGISKLDPSKLPGGAPANLTQSNALIGSPLYMPPEQLQAAHDADARADIWSLGCILYELLAGHPVWQKERIHEVLTSILSNKPAKIRAERPEVPEALEAAILTCLEKEPASRFDTVNDLAARLAPHADASGAQSIARLARGVCVPPDSVVAWDVQQSPSHVGSEAKSNQSTLDAPLADLENLPSSSIATSRRKHVAGLAAVVVAVAGVAALVFFRSSDHGTIGLQDVSAASEVVPPVWSAVPFPTMTGQPIATASATPPEGSLPPSVSSDVEPSRIVAPRTAATGAVPGGIPSRPPTVKKPSASPPPTQTPAQTPPAQPPPIYDGGRY